jgi:hypothetical protein
MPGMTGGRPSALRRATPAFAALLTFAVVVAVVAGVLRLRDDDRSAAGRTAAEAVPLTAQVVQLRRDEVAKRVEVALRTTGGATVQVDRLRLRAGGFTGAGWVRLDYPLTPNGATDFITGYGETRCPSSGAPRLGRVHVDVQWHTDADPTPRTGVLVPVASRPLLSRILRGDCRAKHLTSQVRIGFGSGWRTVGAGADIALHTTLEATLSPGSPPRDLTQVSGSVLYGLAPDGAAPGGAASPLAALDPAHPHASVPVVLTQARCTGHAKGEIKQPYLFLVWVGDPGTAGTAVELPVTPEEKARLRAVCAF